MTLASIVHGCKINYALKVGGRLPSGYHEIESIFLPVNTPSDRLEITRSHDTGGICVSFHSEGQVAEGVRGIDPVKNSLVLAYECYAGLTGFRPGLEVRVHKNIPAGGGLGGGSANAAAFLLFLQQQLLNAGGEPLSETRLTEAAAGMGADIPFFIYNRPAYVSGIGEEISFIENTLAGRFLVLACPSFSISTAWAYAELDRKRELAQASGNNVQKDCKNRDGQGLTSKIHQANNSTPAKLFEHGNDFEDVVFIHYPELVRLKEDLLSMGAEIARLSGTGASIFAVFRKAESAQIAVESLAKQDVLMYTLRM